MPFVTWKLEVLQQHSRFFKQIIQYSDITPGSLHQILINFNMQQIYLQTPEHPCRLP
ncbi:hypothetical protein T03_4522 [Trichinella britovi]|uniref:Uncharacterized protein n=1 Tax=Trichinella britovi TaxID=45882 RepID=A0A0V1AQZ8_TRIBR|nr:hypothetical protein T03_4522 [Trichinella britovi]